jgi:sugar lactone lactonase YvrE
LAGTDLRERAGATDGRARAKRQIHGGLRYLVQREFGLVRENLREREILLRTAPHLVLPVYGPLYRLSGAAPSSTTMLSGGLVGEDTSAGEGHMFARSWRVPLALLVLAMLLASAVPVQAKSYGVSRFATLPPGPGRSEGIAADAAGNIYAATFEFPPAPNKIHAFGPNGKLKFSISVAFSPLGMIVGSDGGLWVTDFGNGRAVKYSPPFSDSSTPSRVIDVCGGAGAGCGLNAFDFDGAGNLFVSDSFGGRIFKIDLQAGTVTTWFTDERLRPGTHAFPGFGANGLAFSADRSNLFIANTGDDRIFKLRVSAAPTAADLTTFAESVNGADGIAFDSRGRLWTAANQADELVALNANGRVVARRGSFRGVGRDGAARGLLFPASLVLSRGSFIVTNAALALTPAAGDEPEEDVRTFTLARVELNGGDRDDLDEDDGEDGD